MSSNRIMIKVNIEKLEIVKTFQVKHLFLFREIFFDSFIVYL